MWLIDILAVVQFVAFDRDMTFKTSDILTQNTICGAETEHRIPAAIKKQKYIYTDLENVLERDII